MKTIKVILVIYLLFSFKTYSQSCAVNGTLKEFEDSLEIEASTIEMKNRIILIKSYGVATSICKCEKSDSDDFRSAVVLINQIIQLQDKYKFDKELLSDVKKSCLAKKDIVEIIELQRNYESDENQTFLLSDKGETYDVDLLAGEAEKKYKNFASGLTNSEKERISNTIIKVKAIF